jgi:hypothetical protein
LDRVSIDAAVTDLRFAIDDLRLRNQLMAENNRQSSINSRLLRITEVGPRDGLQNEPGVIKTQDKIRFIDALSETGVAEIEVSSFVSPKWVPQLGDASEVFRHIRRAPGVT